jgi:uncharacterized Zn finger protein
MRETAAMKARRLLVEGRVTVRFSVGSLIEADVRGDSGQVYRVIHSPGKWSCPCAARGRCSHVDAVMAIAAVPVETPR